MKKRNEPVTHMLHTLKNYDLPKGAQSAISEFIDNSLGDDSGNADNVFLVYNRGALVIQDDGKGIRDLNAMSTLGSSLSRLSASDIGNFGWGSKVGTLWLGWHQDIKTVVDGRYHHYVVNWKECLDSGLWPESYDSEGKIVTARSPLKVGTRITIGNRHEGRGFQLDSMADRLAHIYGPGLRKGKEITLIYYLSNGDEKKIHLSSRLNSNKLIDEITFPVNVNGKRAKVTAGAMIERKGMLNGVHISYGHRVIRTEKAFPTLSMPAKLCVYVDLAQEWKTSLTATKNDLAHDKTELIAQVEEGCAELVEKLQAEIQEKRLDLLNAQISQAINQALAAANADEGLFKAVERVRAKAGIRGKSDKPSKPSAGPNETNADEADFDPDNPGVDADEKAKSVPPFGIKYNIADLGDEAYKIDPSDTQLLVTLNSSIDMNQKAYSNPVQGYTIWSSLVHSLALWWFSGGDEQLMTLKKLLPAFAADLDSGTDLDEIQHQVLKMLLSMAPDIKEPSRRELESALADDDDDDNE